MIDINFILQNKVDKTRSFFSKIVYYKVIFIKFFIGEIS